jgi:hypothetical protein
LLQQALFYSFWEKCSIFGNGDLTVNRFLSVAFLATLGVMPQKSFGQNLSYYNWSGSDDFDNPQFHGCHMDSPPSLKLPHTMMRIISDDRRQFFIQFAVRFENQQPIPGTTAIVNLALANDKRLPKLVWNDHGRGTTITDYG